MSKTCSKKYSYTWSVLPGTSRWEESGGGATPSCCCCSKKEDAHHRGCGGGEAQRGLGSDLWPWMDNQKHPCGLRHVGIPTWKEGQQELLQVRNQIGLFGPNSDDLRALSCNWKVFYTSSTKELKLGSDVMHEGHQMSWFAADYKKIEAMHKTNNLFLNWNALRSWITNMKYFINSLLLKVAYIFDASKLQ